eukprot:EG_transcript_36644
MPVRREAGIPGQRGQPSAGPPLATVVRLSRSARYACRSGRDMACISPRDTAATWYPKPSSCRPNSWMAAAGRHCPAAVYPAASSEISSTARASGSNTGAT